MVYKWYILPIGGLYATYHLLGEPETTIEVFQASIFRCYVSFREGNVFGFHRSVMIIDQDYIELLAKWKNLGNL